MVTGGVARANLFAVQTPQIFGRELLKKAYSAIFDAGREVTDEISAVEEVGGKVVLLPNDEPNFKITYPADLPLAEFVLRQRASAGGLIPRAARRDFDHAFRSRKPSRDSRPQTISMIQQTMSGARRIARLAPALSGGAESQDKIFRLEIYLSPQSRK